VQVVRRLLDVDHVFAITASSGTASTMAALPLAEAKGVPMLQTAAPNTVMVTPIHKNLFVVGVAYGPGTEAVVKAMASRKPNARWIAVVQDDEFGDDVQAGYERALKELNLPSLAVMRYKRGQVDFSAEILKAKQLGATVILSGGIIGENVAMAKEMRRIGLDAQLVINWSARLPQTLDLMGEAGNGVIAADYVGDFNDAAGERFMTSARKYLTADEIKSLNRTSLTGYVGYRLLFDAIRRCGTEVTRACVIEKLETTQNLNVDGIMSPISFTPTTRLATQTLRFFVDDYASRQWRALPAQ
jgi:branched-chain amino acid transport system substrate-binding protein